MAAYGAIGVAVGALVPNQIAAVVGVLVWMLAVEQIAIPVLPEVGRWMPCGSAGALLQLGPSYGFDDGQLLSAPAGGLVLGAYLTAAVLLALRITPKRDVH